MNLFNFFAGLVSIINTKDMSYVSERCMAKLVVTAVLRVRSLVNKTKLATLAKECMAVNRPLPPKNTTKCRENKNVPPMYKDCASDN